MHRGIIVILAYLCRSTTGFAPSALTSRASAFHSSKKSFSFRKSYIKAESTPITDNRRIPTTKYDSDFQHEEFNPFHHVNNGDDRPTSVGPSAFLASLSLLLPTNANAATTGISTGLYNPDTFKPVCSASDAFYRFLQSSTRTVVGTDNFSEYGPLIAGGLLRIRLELCVVESFFNEAVGPFIRENGLSWILPWHETVETFLAGTIFALATVSVCSFVLLLLLLFRDASIQTLSAFASHRHLFWWDPRN